MRKVYLVPKEMTIEDAIKKSKLLGIGEIVHGISPKMQRETSFEEKDLPLVYEEPETPEPIKRDIAQEIDELKARLAKLEVIK